MRNCSQYSRCTFPSSLLHTNLSAHGLGDVEEDGLYSPEGCVVVVWSLIGLQVSLQEEVDVQEEPLDVQLGKDLGNLFGELPQTLATHIKAWSASTNTSNMHQGLVSFHKH